MTRPVSGVHGSGLRCTFTGISNLWSLTTRKESDVQARLDKVWMKAKLAKLLLSQCCEKTLTVSGDLLDRLQDLAFHFRISADLLPCPLYAPLFGQFCELFLIGNHEADHIVLITARAHNLKQTNKSLETVQHYVACPPLNNYRQNN